MKTTANATATTTTATLTHKRKHANTLRTHRWPIGLVYDEIKAANYFCGKLFPATDSAANFSCKFFGEPTQVCAIIPTVSQIDCNG